MRRINGTVSVSMSDFDDLRETEAMFESLRRTVRGLVISIDTEQYEKELKKIDDMRDISDIEIDKLCEQAATTLKIIISERNLRKLVHDHIDDEKSRHHYEISEMGEEKFLNIPLIIGDTTVGGQCNEKQD